MEKERAEVGKRMERKCRKAVFLFFMWGAWSGVFALDAMYKEGVIGAPRPYILPGVAALLAASAFIYGVLRFVTEFRKWRRRHP